MRAVYIIGPSGAGKSTLCVALAVRDVQFVHVSLDKEVKRIAPGFEVKHISDWEIRWRYCEQALMEITLTAAPDLVHLVDTGAGALMATAGRAYLLDHSSHVICLNGRSEIIYERNKEKFIARGLQPRSYADFYADEFSARRKSMYDAAQFTIDTTATDENASLEALREAIKAALV